MYCDDGPGASGKAELQTTAGLVAYLRSADCTERALEASGGWLWETDIEHRFRYMSDGVKTLAQRSAESHYGKTRQEIGNFSIDDPAMLRWTAPLERREGFGPFDFMRPQGGGLLTFRTVGVPCFDAIGTFTGYRGIAFRVDGAIARPLVARDMPRHRVMEAAEIVIGSQETLFCVMQDLSATGARLLVTDAHRLPGLFGLRTSDASVARPCEVRWRQSDSIGVRFLGSSLTSRPSSQPPDDRPRA